MKKKGLTVPCIWIWVGVFVCPVNIVLGISIILLAVGALLKRL
jgi:hypothetical protein